MNILFVTDVFPPRSYGSGQSAHQLARGLRARGHDLRVVLAQPARTLTRTSYDDFPVWEPELGARLLPPAFFAASGLGPGKTVRGLVQSWRPDVIHAQHVNSALVAARAAGGAPVVITVRDHWPICFYGTALASVPCPSCLRGTQSPCNTARGRIHADALRHMAKATAMRAMLTQRQRVLRNAAAVIAVSGAIADELRQASPPASLHRLSIRLHRGLRGAGEGRGNVGVVPPERLQIIPNGVDLAAAMQAAAMPPDASLPPAYFLYVGKIAAHKGGDLLPAIARALPPDAPPIIVFGDGPEEAAIRAFDPAGERIRLLGVRPNAAVLAAMAHATALIAPARWNEPLSRKDLEALATGCPLVATATGGTAEIVVDGETGFLVPRDDVQAMAARLTQLARNPATRARMAAASQQRAIAIFSLERVVAQHEDVYASVVRGRA